MKGDVVVVPFPYSDLSGTKKRPALVVIDEASDSDVVLAAITTSGNAPSAINLNPGDLETGSLHHSSFVRATKLFTFERRQLLRIVGHLKQQKHIEVVAAIRRLLEP